MPWVVETPPESAWAEQTPPTGYFDASYFDPAYFDTGAPAWTIINPSENIWTEQ